MDKSALSNLCDPWLIALDSGNDTYSFVSVSSRALLDNDPRTELALVSWAKRVGCCRRNKSTYLLGPGKVAERALENQHSGSLTLESDYLE